LIAPLPPLTQSGAVSDANESQIAYSTTVPVYSQPIYSTTTMVIKRKFTEADHRRKQVVLVLHHFQLDSWNMTSHISAIGVAI
jgi:hypothetical protein